MTKIQRRIIKRFSVVLKHEFNGDHAAMAAMLGLDKSTVSRNQAGLIVPSRKTIRALNSKRGISTQWLQGKTGVDDKIEYEPRKEVSFFEFPLPLVSTLSAQVPRASLVMRQAPPALLHRDRYYARAGSDSGDGRIKIGDYVLLHVIAARTASRCDIGGLWLIERETLVIDRLDEKDVVAQARVHAIVIRIEVDINEGLEIVV